MIDYLVGTGGWAYFQVPGTFPLKTYSEIFNFVEVNYTFYTFPEMSTIQNWRKIVPEDFAFSLRCHQSLSHQLGLKPVEDAFYIIGKMLAYCDVLNSQFLVIETPARYVFGRKEVDNARDFLSSINMKGVRLVWEMRAPITKVMINLMQDFNIIQSVDLSHKTPSVHSDVVYSRLFGKGRHNIYQFTDEELYELDRKIESIDPRIAALSYHGVRMNADAARFISYKKTGQFLPVTSFTGIASARAVLSEDTNFPLGKSELIKQQGWKVIDLTEDLRIHLYKLLLQIPDKTYESVEEVTKELRTVI